MVIRNVRIALLCCLSGILSGCLVHSVDASGKYGFQDRFQGRSYECLRDIYLTGDGEYANLEFSWSYRPRELKDFTGDNMNQSTRLPKEMHLQFHVDKLVHNTGTTGGYRMLATVLNGTLKGKRIDVICLFLPDHQTDPTSSSGFIDRPDVRPIAG